MEKKMRESLAIIGIGCRFPGNVNTPDEFWKLIIEKGNALTDVPSDRWNTDELFAPDFKQAGKISVRQGGFIKDIDKFDASFLEFLHLRHREWIPSRECFWSFPMRLWRMPGGP